MKSLTNRYELRDAILEINFDNDEQQNSFGRYRLTEEFQDNLFTIKEAGAPESRSFKAMGEAYIKGWRDREGPYQEDEEEQQTASEELREIQEKWEEEYDFYCDIIHMFAANGGESEKKKRAYCVKQIKLLSEYIRYSKLRDILTEKDLEE